MNVFIPKSIQIVYFSGSGGAKRVAEAFEAECEKKGVPSQIHAIDRSPAYLRKHPAIPSFDPEGLTLLLYAVHAFDAPSPVYHWIESLDIPAQLKFAVVSVSGGGEVWPNTGCRSLVIKELEKKGCEVVCDAIMVMPSNMNPAGNDDAAAWILKALPLKVREITGDLLSGKGVRTKYKMDPFRVFATRQEKKNAYRFAKTVRVLESCNGCGWCADNCPENNIRMENGKPVLGYQCVVCFRCIYGCPTRALGSKNALVIQTGFCINEVEKRMQGRELSPVSECCPGILWKGVRKYLESVFPDEKTN